MKIETGDAFRTDTGTMIRVSRVYDVYDTYDVEHGAGRKPTTKVRYGQYWHEDGVMYGRDTTLDEFLGMIVERVPDEDVPDVKKPKPLHKRR